MCPTNLEKQAFQLRYKTLIYILLGEIHGTLHREVWEQFAAELVVGAVLVIRNVGLLSTGISSRRHYLNITANNLVTIYSASSGNSALFKIILRF